MNRNDALAGFTGSDLLQLPSEFFFGDLLVVVSLEVQPYIGGPFEIAGEAQRGIDRDRTLALHDLVDAAGWNADVLGDALLNQGEDRRSDHLILLRDRSISV